MKPVVRNEAPREPQQPTQIPKIEISSSSMFGFPVSINPFQSLEDLEPAVSTSQRQIQNRLVDPRKTRLERQQAARNIDEQGTFGNLSSEGICGTVPPVRDAQGILNNGDCVEPVASGIRHPHFPNSLSVSPPDILELQSGGVVQHLLEIGVVSDDALYLSDVNDVACTLEPCNKRISYAGLERLVGRPGHTPTRCDLACRKTIEDRVAG